MTLPVRLLVLTEDTAASKELQPEHGLSLWIEVDGRRILFDTGQGPALVHNAEVLGVDLSEATDIVLSHGHYDHGGGLAHVLGINRTARVFAHPGCTIRRFSKKTRGPARSIGLAREVVESLRPRATWVSQPTRISDSVTLTGTISRTWCFEQHHDGLFIDSQGLCPDPVVDDQAIVIATGGQRLVVLGCAHAGVANTVQYALQLSPAKGPVSVAGGMHLRGVPQGRVDETVDALRTLGVSRVVCGHCTGESAGRSLQHAYGEACTALSAGESYSFG
jgi:7,8-dihydropterin-6-yl-methyl-4-(beta-D-ribofuranosyl)aminobenzene 5'-phosphate synthase